MTADQYNLTGRALRQLEQYEEDPLPSEVGSRFYVYYRNGWWCGPSNDGFNLKGRNEMNRSRCYKDVNNPKTAGRKDVWSEVLGALGDLV